MKIKTIRRFEKNHKITKNTWMQIFESIRYTPSSFDLQPWHFFIIQKKKNKKKLKTCLIGNETQLLTSSAMILLCGNLCKKENSAHIYQKKLFHNEITKEQQKMILEQIYKTYDSLNPYKLKNEIFFECGLIAANFVLELQKSDYNACFIGGCQFEKINSLFDIPPKYTPIILIAVGKEDTNANLNMSKLPSFKLPPKNFISFL
ncbi:nitroreductase family protein [Candidatus Phytoplasma melaleucae]|uniref:Nitroreductase family protein n=1 Tax=Candidatus Phytoplasma melaleucae TaxID=2982630 RepID=A0ABT9DDI0_9MOLU|nr:nitroreductase family protein ['Melaleuca sp.' phytoplasma]MDO8167933.1 nitroreductase family protein ['Melaleuca sp.' phytoplasma]MDV3205159.1 nitroreductase family protein [Weeping tea tree witches'-broom phytoplasma]